MAAPCVPTAAAVAELLTSLFGKPARVTKGTGTSSRPTKGAVAYATAGGALRGAAFCDLEFAAAAAAALSMLPPAIAAEAVRKGSLDESLLENAQEVFNVLAQVLNVGREEHVRASAFYLPPKQVPPEVTQLSTKAKLRAEYDVTVQGYAPSRLVIFVDEK